MTNTGRKEKRCGWFALAAFLGVIIGCGDPLDEVRELHSQGRYADSLEPLRELVDSHPDDPEVHYRYGVALRRLGNPHLAVWSLRKASEHPDWMVGAGLELAIGAISTLNWVNAIEATDQILEAEPDNVRALLLRGQARVGQKTAPERALVDLDRALELDPKNLSIQVQRAQALIMARREDEALTVIETLEREGLESSLDVAILGQFCVTRAMFAIEKKLLDEAEVLFDECLARFPTHTVVLSQAASFFDARERRDRATEAYRVALDQQPHAINFRTALSGRLQVDGDREGAEQVLRAGLEFDDRHLRASTWAGLANFYLRLEEFDQAANAYGESLALVADPAPIAVLTFADLLVMAGRHERALEVARRLESDGLRGLIEARVHLAEGRPERALERLDEVLPEWPNNAGARYHAARAAEQIGDFDRAIEEYRQSIRSDAKLTEAGLRLAKLSLASGMPHDAWIAASHHFNAHPNDEEGMQFLVRVTGRMQKPDKLRQLMRQLRRTSLWSRAVALNAERIAGGQGPEAAVESIRASGVDDFTHPYHAELLRSLVVHMSAAGQLSGAQEASEAALTAHPDAAAFHEIRGWILESTEASPTAILAAYERSVELDSKQFRALEALGRIAQDRGDAETALAYYDRATAARLERPWAARRAAQLVTEASRFEEAEERWEIFLREHPWDAEAALALVRLRLERGAETDRTLELAERAVRFRGGAPAQILLAEVHEARGEPEITAEVRTAAQRDLPPDE